MSSNCAFVPASGRTCGAPALHNDRYCRHHTPAALARRRARSLDPDCAPLPSSTDAATDPDKEVPPAHLRAYWRTHHRTIAASNDDDQCAQIFAMVLDALSAHAIGPRSAGRLLQAVQDRRQFLAHKAQQAALRAFEERVRCHQANSRHTNIASEARRPDAQSLLEALTSTVFPSAAPPILPEHPFGAPKNYRVSR